MKDASHLTYLSLNILFCERNGVRLVQLSLVELVVKKNTKQQQLMQNLSSGVTLIVVGTMEILTLQTSSVCIPSNGSLTSQWLDIWRCLFWH